MGRARWFAGLAFSGLLMAEAPVAAGNALFRPAPDAVVSREERAPQLRDLAGSAAAPLASDSPTITLTLMGFAPEMLSVYTGEPITWLNLLPVTAHLWSGLPFKAYLPRLVGAATGPPAPVLANKAEFVRPMNAPEPFSATIVPGAQFVYTFTTPGDYDYYASELLTRTGRVSVMPRPDLALSSLVLSPATVAVSATATISAVVTNAGPGPAGPFAVSWQATPLWPTGAGGLYGGDWMVPGLASGESVVLTVMQVVTQPGALRVSVSVDPGDGVPETSEANNLAEGELGVLGTIEYCGTISGNATWAYAVFVPTCSISILDAATLTVRSGAIVKPRGPFVIYVNGQLNAIGEPGVPIVFTSHRDDMWGGDTNGDGSATLPAAQDWNAISVEPGGRANLSWARVRYGGSGYNGNFNNQGVTALDHMVSELGWRGLWSGSGSLTTTESAFNSNIWEGATASGTALTVTDSVFMSNTNGVGLGVTGGSLLATGNQFATNAGGLAANGGSVTLSGNTIRGNAGIGVNAQNIYAPVITGNLVLSNTGHAIYVSESSKPLNSGQIQANTLAGNGVNGVVLGGSLSGESVVVNVPGVVYGIAGLTVNGDGTLLVEPGNVVKFMGGQTLSVYGTLTVAGTMTETVMFTSLRDDGWGGDTNSDGSATQPAPLDWNTISVEPGGRANLSWARLRYGGSSYNGNLNNQGVMVLDHAVSELGWRGLWSGGGTLTIANSRLSQNIWEGATASNTAMTVTNSLFVSNTNGVGLGVTGGSLLAAGNQFASNVGGLTANGGSLTVCGNTIGGNAGIGVNAQNIYAPVITANVVISNTGYAIYVREYGLPLNTGQIQANTLAGNGANGVVLGGGLSGASVMFRVPGVVYGIAGLTVNADGSLLVEPGNVVKFMGGQTLSVYGTLTVAGTTTDMVVFTSLCDDGWGGDTNSDGAATAGAAQDWNAISVEPGGRASLSWARLRYGGSGYNGNLNNQGATVLDHVVSELGWRGLWSGSGSLMIADSSLSQNIWDGATASNTAMTVTNSLFVSDTNGVGLAVTGGSLLATGNQFAANAGGLTANGGGLILSANTIRGNAGIGVNAQNIYAPVITGNVVLSNTSHAIFVSESSKPVNTGQIQANTLAGNGANGVVLGGSLSGEAVVVKVPGVVYGIAGLTVNGDGSLLIEAGNVLKFMGGQNLNVYGTLTVAGTTTETIVFTSIRDDVWGGDTNSNGSATAGAPQDWNAISVELGGLASLTWARLRYGGSGYNGNLNNQGVTALDHVLSELGWRGLWSGSGALTIADSRLSQNIWDGAAASNTALTVTNSVFMSNTNGAGLAFSGSLSPTISGSSFVGNPTWGLNSTAVILIDARQNWWNSPTGPTHPSNPSGNGDKVSDGVIFTPFLTAAP